MSVTGAAADAGPGGERLHGEVRDGSQPRSADSRWRLGVGEVQDRRDALLLRAHRNSAGALARLDPREPGALQGPGDLLDRLVFHQLPPPGSRTSATSVSAFSLKSP